MQVFTDWSCLLLRVSQRCIFTIYVLKLVRFYCEQNVGLCDFKNCCNVLYMLLPDIWDIYQNK